MELLLQLAGVLDLFEPNCSRDQPVDKRSTTLRLRLKIEAEEHFLFRQAGEHAHQRRK